jgi:hypothetical protein
MVMSSTFGDPAAFAPGPDHARAAASRQLRAAIARVHGHLANMRDFVLSKDDAASGAHSKAVRIMAAMIRSKELASRAKESAMAALAMMAAAAELIPHLEQPQADELLKEVKAFANELFVGLNELFVGLNEILARSSIFVAMVEMPYPYISEKFAELAKIQDSKRRMFEEHVSKALTAWSCSAILDIRSGSTAPRLRRMKRNLIDVCELSGVGGDDLLLKLSLECEITGISITDVIDGWKKIKAVIERTLPRGQNGGRPAGIRQYPELDALVYRLEFSAQVAGGKFTVHKKNGGKGTIIEALNLLRNVVRVSSGEKLAAAIPLPAKHPISTYARAIHDARKAAAAALGLAGHGSRRGRRLCPPPPA